MKNKNTFRLRYLLLGVLFTTVSLPAFAQCRDGSKPMGWITNTFDLVEITHGNEPYKPAAKGHRFCRGDILRTGTRGRARVELFDHIRIKDVNRGPTVINIATSTKIEMVKLSIAETDVPKRFSIIRMIKGVIRYHMKNWGASSSFRVRTGTSICGIRGSHVASTYDPARGMTEHLVENGTMTCPLRNNKEILARGGQMIQWRRGQRPVVRKLDRALWRKHVAATSVRPRRRPQGCKAILGSWKWPRGSTVSFTGDGRSGSASARGHPKIRSGVWRCTGPNTAKITWDGGKYIDTVRLSGNALSATNQTGYRFRATRSSR